MNDLFYGFLFLLFSIMIFLMVALAPTLVILWWLKKVRNALISLFTWPSKK